MTAFHYGRRSRGNLDTCQAALIQVAERALELNEVDIAVTCGLRGMADQNKAYFENVSDLLWPFGKHNVYRAKPGIVAPTLEALYRQCNVTYEQGRMVIADDDYARMLEMIEEDPNGKARAVDLAPYFSDGRRIPWEDTFTWQKFGGFIIAVGHTLGVCLRWGGDWDGDWTNKDQKFHDLPHFELIT